MKLLKKWILVSAMMFCASVFANTYTSSLSDTWWNENEAGWGVQVNHQRDLVFLTFFVYGTDGRPSWFTGQASHVGEDSRGALVFKGDLHQFNGPANGTVFNSAAVTSRNVGTVTFTAFLDAATLTYTLEGASEYKLLTRQTFRHNDSSGEYTGAIKQTQTFCRLPFVNGDFNRSVEYTVANTATTFSMTTRQLDGNTCKYIGDYEQTGRLGRSHGTYTCTGGLAGTYDIFELDASIQGISGQYFAGNNLCGSVVGRFAAMRK